MGYMSTRPEVGAGYWGSWCALEQQLMAVAPVVSVHLPVLLSVPV